MPPLGERRRWPRLPLAIPVFVSGPDEKGKEFLEFSTILNVSAGGVLFVTRRHLQHGSRVLLEIPTAFPEWERASQARRKFQARIVRTNRQDKWYWCAAHFLFPLLKRTRIAIATASV